MPPQNADAVRFLVSSQLISGGWGYEPGAPAVVESTAAGVLALRAEQAVDETLKRAINWLISSQNEDGGWGLNAKDTHSNWHTAWAVLALQRAGHAGSQTERGIHWLLTQPVMQYTDAGLLSEGSKIAKIDFSIRGWPWQPGEASWVEPTAIAMLALEHAKDQTSVHDRLAEAVRYLLDRRVPGGGWNVGNPVMFSSILPARAHPTAWSLLALNVLAPESILADDIQFLKAEMQRDGGAMGLAWGILALRATGRTDEQSINELVALQQSDGSWEQNPYVTSAALMALEGSW